VVGEKVMVGDCTQATGEGGQFPSKAGANVTERLGGDHVQQKMEGAHILERLGGDHVLQQLEILKRNNQEITLIKDILISLQKDVASCLHMLETGWGKKGSVIQMGSDTDVQGLKDWTSRGEKEDGPLRPKQMVEIMEPVDKPTRVHIINQYKRIYVRRHQHRRWRPKAVGRLDKPVNTESPESDRNLTPEKSKEVMMTKQIGEKGGQVRDGCRMVEENVAGGAAVAGEFLVPRRSSQMELGCGSWGDEIADQQEGVIRSDTKVEELPKGCAIDQFACGQSETSRSGLPSSEYCSASL
jgi:hypothetical protein